MKPKITLLSETKESEQTAHQKHYSQLLKGILIDVAHDENDNAYGLVFRLPNRDVKTAWILCDEEGNGPGFLAIP